MLVSFRKAIPMPKRISDAGQRNENPVECNNLHRERPQGEWPTQPGTTNVAAAIDRLISDCRSRGSSEIEFYDDAPIDQLSAEMQMIVFPIVQELLLNACRHSKSKNVLVGLAQDHERICIQVQDWGVGFDPEQVSARKSGLKGIRQLVEWHGGIVNVDSRLGVGTCVVVEIPLLQETEPSDQRENRRPR